MSCNAGCGKSSTSDLTAVWLPVLFDNTCLALGVSPPESRRHVSAGIDPDQRPRAPAAGRPARTSERAAEISQRHVLDVRKRPDDRVVIDCLVTKLIVAGHDRRRAARRDGRKIAVLLRRLDVAFRALPPDRLAVDDEARAEEVRELGEVDRVSLLDEDAVAQLARRSPCAGEIESAGTLRKSHSHNHGDPQGRLTNDSHVSPPKTTDISGRSAPTS